MPSTKALPDLFTMRPASEGGNFPPIEMASSATVPSAGQMVAGNLSLLFFNTSENGTEAPKPYTEFYNNAQFVTGLVCYPIICFLGLIGNVFILIVLGQKSMATSTNIFLSALAISDIIKLVNDVLYFLTVLLYEVHPASGNKCFGYLYPYAHFVFNMCVCASSWLTVSVAIERYILVCHPGTAKGLVTIKRAKIISALCFLVMTTLAIPSALRYRTSAIIKVDQLGRNYTWLEVNLTTLWENKSFVVPYTWMQSLLRSILPLFVLVFTSSFIINALRQTRANKKLASRNKITIMLIIVIVFFLVCIIPDAVMSAFFNFGYTESNNNLVKGVREITDMLLGVNAAINFPLYMIFNKLFRDQFITLFCKRCKGNTDSKKDEYRRLADSKPVRPSQASPVSPIGNGCSKKNDESVV